MSFVLGIDTGGTNTDAVIVDRARRHIIAKAKSLTTREDLSLGIGDCIRQMSDIDYTQVDFVALSTTLATNAIVEGRGCEVGLLTLGFQPQGNLPAREVRTLPGGHSIHGREKEPFDPRAVREALLSMRGKVDAIAISAYLSVRNPQHELQAQEMARKLLDLPVVCAHHLTRSLGMQERTVTAILNARLIPIINELILSVKKVLGEKNLEVPIMIVKGDGSLMGEAQAKNRPIETLLSGPAASIIGASFLTAQDDAMVLDMGGTTTDIAVLHQGMPRINKEGARVGGWLTRVEAADISTYGLGGDSYVQMDMQLNLCIGPQRVWPFCLACLQYPHLMDELNKINIPRQVLLLFCQVTDCFRLLNEKESVLLSERERQVVELLREKPHSVFYLAQHLGDQVYTMNLDRLVNAGVIGRISVTPTDVLHARGGYRQWSEEGARLACTLIARRFHKTLEEFCAMVEEKMVSKLCYTCWQSLVNQEEQPFNLAESELFAYLASKQLEEENKGLFHCEIRPNVPVIGIGAPVAAWLPPMAEKLKARLLIPEYTEVANAVGAAAGRVMEVVSILINPGEHSSGYILHSAWERIEFKELEEAVAYALQQAEQKAREQAMASGAKRVRVAVDHRDIYARANQLENDIYIESRIEAVATEESDWSNAAADSGSGK